MAESSGKPFPIRPVGDHLVVRVDESGEYEGEHGFVLPKNYHQRPMLCEVVELGDGFDNGVLGLEVGSKVLLPKYGATGISTAYGKYQLAHRKDIIGVL